MGAAKESAAQGARPRWELADVLRLYGEQYRREHPVPPSHQKVLHAIEVCAGIDDMNPRELKIMPRVPDPLTGIEVDNHFTLVPEGDGFAKARVAYVYERAGRFSLTSDRPLPTLAVRLGPFSAEDARAALGAAYPDGSTTRIEASGHYDGSDAWWVWIEGLRDVAAFEIAWTR